MNYSAVDVELKRDTNRKMSCTVRQMRDLTMNISLKEFRYDTIILFLEKEMMKGLRFHV